MRLTSVPINTETPKLIVNGDTLSDPTSVAAAFNNHYTTVAHKLATKIPPTMSDPCLHVTHVQNSFVFFPTSTVKIENYYRFQIKGFPSPDIPKLYF